MNPSVRTGSWSLVLCGAVLCCAVLCCTLVTLETRRSSSIATLDKGERNLHLCPIARITDVSTLDINKDSIQNHLTLTLLKWSFSVQVTTYLYSRRSISKRRTRMGHGGNVS
ncbi:hypothetical protein M501DRAFT_993613 [Patellaria atrata CBS 101060]|uniref:Secreted protein n=1 Tax=Patellaria atrata CBS 101060 TaxID=1346257 RepID=A0A9P4SJB1_9PEZI|nr:hypothetical protein M501DRAFT_993613 [Patellaria atrata CBS 101060]